MKKIKFFTIIMALFLCLFVVSCSNCKKKKNNVKIDFIVENQTVATLDVEKGYTLVTSDFPTDPTKDNYQFSGWYHDDLKISAGYVVNEDLQIVARFEKISQVTIKFIVDNTEVSTKTVDPGYTLTEADFPTDPKKDKFQFDGWFIGSIKVEVGYEVVENVNIIAKFSEEKIDVKQDGTKEYPYLIKTPADLINFADRLNHFDEETEDLNYYEAYFALDADIDMTGFTYTPAGKEITILNDDGEEEVIKGFAGAFDGRGHTISNLKVAVSMKTNREYDGGLFGLTYMAYIHDLKLDNIDYEVESGSDDANREIYMGGVVGHAILTVFENIDVTGQITTKVFENNGAYLGGIAGMWDVRDGSKAYYVDARNCHTNIETVIGEVDGEKCSLENGVNGGLFGYVSTYNGAVAIINSITEGKVYGGKYVGGLVGYLSANNASILDSASYAAVTATAVEVSYTGGLIGMVTTDSLVKDCFFAGPSVRGTRSTSNSYKSYAGGIVGYYAPDDYELYYSAGFACVNSYYKTSVRGANNISNVGTETTVNIDLDFVKETLKWDENSWTIQDNILQAVNVDLKNQTYEVKLIVDGTVVETITKDAKAILGTLEDQENKGSNIFYSWMFGDDALYRYYMPVTKDLEIVAKFYDVSSIAGLYAGTATLYETTDAGLMVLNDDGTLQWINSSTVSGDYKYDGEHIIMNIYNTIGEVSGTLIDGKLHCLISAGMSGDVDYNFSKIELTLFGEYFSPTGDIITFGNEGIMSFQSTGVSNGAYIRGTYTMTGNEIRVSGTNLSAIYSSMNIVNIDNYSITVNFISKTPGVPSIENVTFTKILTKNYSNYPFIDTYNFAYVSGSSPYLQTDYSFVFKDNGTVDYVSAYSTTSCQYYVFNEGKTVKIILEGYASEFSYEEDGNFFHGILNRGTSETKRGIVLAPRSEGKLYGIFISSVGDILFVSEETLNYYLFVDGKYQKDAVVEIDGITPNARITINGLDYILKYESSPYAKDTGYSVALVGPEEGEYTYNGKKIHLDGIGGVSGDEQGYYISYDNNLIVIVTDKDEFIGFNYVEAQEANNVITLKDADQYQGVWFADKEEDGELKKKHYKLLIDGYGHTAFMYLRYDEKNDTYTYTYNWGEVCWVDITPTATGIRCDYNSNQHCEMSFYYNNNLMYSTNFGYLKEIAMYKDGYTGSMLPPSLPTNVVGRYTGETKDGVSVVFNLRQDITGSYAGTPFVGTFDGVDTVAFTINDIVYRFNIETLVLSFNDENITMQAGGIIEEIIPESLCGTWGGGTWEGNGSDKSSTVVIEKDGTIRYASQSFTNATYDYENHTITAKGYNADHEEVTITITFDEAGTTAHAVYKFVYDGEDHTIEGKNLTKQA